MYKLLTEIKVKYSLELDIGAPVLPNKEVNLNLFGTNKGSQNSAGSTLNTKNRTEVDVDDSATDLENCKVNVSEEMEDGKDGVMETAEGRNLGTSRASSTAVISQTSVKIMGGAGLQEVQCSVNIFLLELLETVLL